VDNFAKIAEAALATVEQAFLSQHGRTPLAELPSAPPGSQRLGGKGTAVARDRAQTEDERSAIGIVGEVAAPAWLTHEYSDVRWRSGYAAIVSGDANAGDGFGLTSRSSCAAAR